MWKGTWISLFIGLPSSEVVTMIATQAFYFGEIFSAHCLVPLGQFDFVFSDLLPIKNPYWGRWSFSPRHFSLTILADADQTLFQCPPASQIVQSLQFWPEYKTRRKFLVVQVSDIFFSPDMRQYMIYCIYIFKFSGCYDILATSVQCREWPGCWQVGCGTRAIESKVKNCATSRVA